MTNIAMVAMALIEIDALPIKNSDFPWQTVSHNQRVTVLKAEVPSMFPQDPILIKQAEVVYASGVLVEHLIDRRNRGEWISPLFSCEVIRNDTVKIYLYTVYIYIYYYYIIYIIYI